VARKFWRSLSSSTSAPMYGADNIGSLFEEYKLDGWNLNKIDSLLLHGLDGKLLGGITSSMLYFGMWRSMFGWHTEDMELNSVNYLHHGAPKVWYAVPPAAANRLESLARSHFGDEANSCREFMRHKNIMMSPMQLKSSGVPYARAVQHEGEFMITFPRSYHAGFNMGWNIAEAVNFATKRWIGFGRKASWCNCERYTVRFDMDNVVERIRSRCPKYLSNLPEVGDRIIAHWAGWPGHYLVRINKQLKNGKLVAGSAIGSISAFGEWEFNPRRDQWRWPTKDDIEPKIGDVIAVRIGTWGKSEKEHLAEVVEADEEDELAIVCIKEEKKLKGKHPFNPFGDFWRWPGKKELTSAKSLLAQKKNVDATPEVKGTRIQKRKNRIKVEKGTAKKRRSSAKV